MAKIGEIKVIPSKTPALANTPGLQADRFKQMQKLENQLEVKQAALKATPSDVEKGSDGEPLDQTRKAQVLATLAKQRKDLEIQMDHYLEQLNAEIANAPEADKKELEEAREDILSFQKEEQKSTDVAVKTIEEQYTLQAEAQKVIDEKAAKLQEELNTLREATAGKVIDPEDPNARKLQALNNQLYSLNQQSEILKQAGYTTSDLEDLNKALNSDIEASPTNLYGGVEEQLTDLETKFLPSDEQLEALKDLRQETQRLNPNRVDTDGVTISDSLNTGGFTAVTGVNDKALFGQGAKDVQVSLPSDYALVEGTSEALKDQNGNIIGNSLIVKTGEGNLFKYTKYKVTDSSGKLGYVTRQEPLELKDGNYVNKATTPAKLYYQQQEGGQTFSTVWDASQGEDNPIAYNPGEQAAFAAQALEATQNYTPPSPSENPATSGVGATSTPSTDVSPSTGADQEKSVGTVAKTAVTSALRFGTPLGLAIEGVKATLHGVSIAPKVVEVMTDNKNVGIFDALRVADAGKQAENTEAQKLKEQERAKQKAEQAEDKRKAQQEVDRLIEEAKREGTERAGS
jgi:hypothetical protein